MFKPNDYVWIPCVPAEDTYGEECVVEIRNTVGEENTSSLSCSMKVGEIITHDGKTYIRALYMGAKNKNMLQFGAMGEFTLTPGNVLYFSPEYAEENIMPEKNHLINPS